MSETLILASASPRRQQLLRQMGLSFRVQAANIDESRYEAEQPSDIACEIARKKVLALIHRFPQFKGNWILGADTLIAAGSRIIGKPQTRNEAESLLKRFSGDSHHVITGICLYNKKSFDTVSVKTKVFFLPLSDSRIHWYLDTEEWRDAAGGYRIQGQGACLIRGIIGCYSNVMGLPISTIYSILESTNFPF